MKELGQRLKARRLEKNLTLEEISSQTKIQLSILKKIEDGNSKDLPRFAHLKGFIKQYAQLLELDIEEIMSLYPSLQTPVPPVTSLKKTNSANDDQTNLLWFRTPSRLVTLIGLAVVLCLLMVIYAVTIKIDSYSQEVSEVQTVEDLEEQVSLTLPEPTVDAAPPEAAQDTKTSSAKAEEKKPETKAPKNPKLVILNAFGRVDINAQWSTGKSEKITLQNNHKHTFYYSDKLKISLSNAGLISISSGNKEIGVPGELGQSLELDFD